MEKKLQMLCKLKICHNFFAFVDILISLTLIDSRGDEPATELSQWLNYYCEQNPKSGLRYADKCTRVSFGEREESEQLQRIWGNW